jgi:hypothetical protein
MPLWQSWHVYKLPVEITSLTASGKCYCAAFVTGGPGTICLPVRLCVEIEREGETVDRDGVAGPQLIIAFHQGA